MKGWHAKMHTNKGSYKSEGKYTKPHLHSIVKKDVMMVSLSIFTFIFVTYIPFLCVLFDMPILHHFLFSLSCANGNPH